MTIRRGSVFRRLGERAGGGEASVITTTGGPSITRSLWSVDAENRLVLDPAGEPMVRMENGITALESHASGTVTPVRTTVVGNNIMVY